MGTSADPVAPPIDRSELDPPRLPGAIRATDSRQHRSRRRGQAPSNLPETRADRAPHPLLRDTENRHHLRLVAFGLAQATAAAGDERSRQPQSNRPPRFDEGSVSPNCVMPTAFAIRLSSPRALSPRTEAPLPRASRGTDRGRIAPCARRRGASTGRSTSSRLPRRRARRSCS